MQDIRLFNTDRHAGNMLVKSTKDFSGSTSNLLGRMSESQYELVPIDHGFCLPETLEAPYFEWLHWPQAMLPFSEEEIKYIRELDIEVGPLSLDGYNQSALVAFWLLAFFLN